MVIFIDGKYSFRDELQKYYDIKYRLNDHPDRTKAKFEMRTRKLSPNTADQQILFYEHLIFSWEQYAERTNHAGIIQGIVDLSTDVWTVKEPDSAMLIKNKVGGIDLNRGKMNIQVHSDDGQGVQFHLDPGMIRQLRNASGLAPVIIDIRPMTTPLSIFLGVNEEHVAVGRYPSLCDAGFIVA